MKALCLLGCAGVYHRLTCLIYTRISVSSNILTLFTLFLGEGWHSRESIHLPPIWPGSNPGNTICWCSLWFVLSFLQTLWFSALLKNQNFQFLFNLEGTITFEQVLKIIPKGSAGKQINTTIKSYFFKSIFHFRVLIPSLCKSI